MDLSSRYLIGGRVVGYPFGDRLVCSSLVCHLGEFVIESLLSVFDTRLAIVVDGRTFGIPRARCLVSLLERRPLSWRRQ